MFWQLTYADRVANNAAMIDNFPQRMERFLYCVSQVYFQQESLDAAVTGNDKTAAKKLLSKYEAATQQQECSAARPATDIDN